MCNPSHCGDPMGLYGFKGTAVVHVHAAACPFPAGRFERYAALVRLVRMGMRDLGQRIAARCLVEAEQRLVDVDALAEVQTVRVALVKPLASRQIDDVQHLCVLCACVHARASRVCACVFMGGVRAALLRRSLTAVCISTLTSFPMAQAVGRT